MDRFYRLVVVCAISLVSFNSYSQDEGLVTSENLDNETSVGRLLKINNDYLMNEMYGKSLESGKRLVELYPDNANYNYRYGVALNQASPSLESPIAYLKKAIENTTHKVDMFNVKEKRAPLDAIYYYALSLHRYGEVDQAIQQYQSFLTMVGSKHILYKLAQLNLKQAHNALTIHENEDIVALTLLDSRINSENPEFSPIVSFDGSALYYTSSKYWSENGETNAIDKTSGTYYEDIYMSLYENEEWSESKRLDFCQPDENEAMVSLSIDERRLYIYNSKTGNGDIYYTDYAKGSFNEIKILENKEVNTDKYQPHYNVSSDGKYAFFSSEDKKGGYGGLDIYMITRQADGSWSSPKNLGPEINSEYDEDSPFISFDGKFLYFSSNGEKSIGGYDIFKAEWINGKFTNVQNLGTPINSTYDDLYYTVTADGLNAFISSFRKDGKGDVDIYQIQYEGNRSSVSLLKGRIFMTDGSDRIPENIAVNLNCAQCENTTTAKLLPRMRDGQFMANLEKCKEYEVKYINMLTGDEIAVQKFTTTCEPQFEEIVKELGIELDGDNIIASRLYAFRGNVFNKEGDDLNDITIEVQNQKGKTIFTTPVDAKTGNYETDFVHNLKANKNFDYKVIVKKDGYVVVSKDIEFTTGFEQFIVIDPIGLEKSTTGKDLGKVIVLNPIYYDLNSSYLRKDAKLELDKIVESMNLNPKMVIELRSHTDCRESHDYNIWLSDRRAMRAADYIKRRITNGNARISGKGYGETELLNNCPCDVADDSGCTEEQHQLNRRTEFIIIN